MYDNKKKILIVSNFFYPENKPRAFRATELAKGFCAKGYSVDVIIPNKEVFRRHPIKVDNLNIIYTEEKLIKSNSPIKSISSTNNLKSRFKRVLKTLVFYFFPSEIYFYYNHSITKQIINTNKVYDKVISISQPLSIHLSIVIGKLFNKNIRQAKMIAEFSDPMFQGTYRYVFPLNILYGFIYSWNFDFFVVPISNAVKKFTLFKKKNKIKVIPQGFKMDSIRLANYQKNQIVSFCYAGSFYKKLRDPMYFFEFLKDLNRPFLFELYLPERDPFRNVIGNLNLNQGKIVIHDFIPREELIIELSKKDFLINFENENSAMSPSKLIDYALTTRPILSFNKQKFNKSKFIEFYNGDYDQREIIDLNEFDIKNVIEKYDKI